MCVLRWQSCGPPASSGTADTGKSICGLRPCFATTNEGEGVEKTEGTADFADGPYTVSGVVVAPSGVGAAANDSSICLALKARVAGLSRFDGLLRRACGA